MKLLQFSPESLHFFRTANSKPMLEAQPTEITLSVFYNDKFNILSVTLLHARKVHKHLKTKILGGQ